MGTRQYRQGKDLHVDVGPSRLESASFLARMAKTLLKYSWRNSLVSNDSGAAVNGLQRSVQPSERYDQKVIKK